MNPRATAPEKWSPSAMAVAFYCACFAMVAAFLDISLSILHGKSEFTGFFLILVPAGVDALLFFVVGGFVFGAAFILHRFYRINAHAFFNAGLLFILALFTLAALENLIKPNLGVDEKVRLLFVFGFCLLLFFSAYFALLHLFKNEKSREILSAFALGGPLVFFGLAYFSHTAQRAIFGGSIVTLGLPAWLIYSACIFFVARRFSKGLVFKAILGALFFVCMAVPPIFFIRHNAMQNAPMKYSHQGRKISRIILITVDTLRADALSCLSENGAPTVNIDALAADGVLFSRAFTPAPWTVPAFASIMTGLSPKTHRITGVADRIAPPMKTLAEKLNQSGYATAAIGKNPMLIPTNVAQGFDGFTWFPRAPLGYGLGARILKKLAAITLPTDADSARLTDIAEHWLRVNKDGQFFLWLHYLDPHLPYKPPPQFLPDSAAPAGLSGSFDMLVETRRGFFAPTPEQVMWIKDLYLSEVRYVDNCIGRLVATLKNLGLYDDSLIIVASDHGEEFWEHGGFEHGHSMFNELLWVPFIIKPPRFAEKEKVVKTQVSITSIMPTIFDQCGIEFDGDEYSAPSLSELLYSDGQNAVNHPVISSANLYYEKQEAILSDGVKDIRYLLQGKDLLFEHTTDFRETGPIDDGDQVQRLHGLLESDEKTSLELRQKHKLQTPQSQKIDEGTLDQLKSLGYVQ